LSISPTLTVSAVQPMLFRCVTLCSSRAHNLGLPSSPLLPGK
jgi:hypothetical protein